MLIADKQNNKNKNRLSLIDFRYRINRFRGNLRDIVYLYKLLNHKLKFR
jgi:hypothetical protein